MEMSWELIDPIAHAMIKRKEEIGAEKRLEFIRKICNLAPRDSNRKIAGRDTAPHQVFAASVSHPESVFFKETSECFQK